MKETVRRPQDEEEAVEYSYDGSGACCLRSLWADAYGGLWLESVDGQRVVVPQDARGTVAKRVREAKFR